MRARVVPSIFVSLTAAALLTACTGSQAPAETAKPAEPLFKPVDPAQVTDALATPGVSRYWGVLPCADCAGIRTELMLLQDPSSGEPQTYELTETHLGTMSQEEKPFTTRGRWSIARGLGADTAATVFVLDGGGKSELARRFERLNDRELRLLDREGKRIASTLNYVLTRVSQTAATLTLPAATLPTGTPGGAPAGVPGPAAMVTDMASGWPVALSVGQEMTARLTADRASGARWSVRPGSDAGVVSVEGAPTTDAPAGQARVEVFRLKAAKAGATTLTFDLKKGTETVRSVSYPVTVR